MNNTMSKKTKQILEAHAKAAAEERYGIVTATMAV